MAWTFALDPRQGELLTSYLARVAHSHGSDAGAFCRFHLGDSWFFTRDVDRGVAVARHDAIARLSGMRVEQISELTLRSWICATTPASYRQKLPPAVAPWINAVGIDHAKRRHRAVAYCPNCLVRGVAFKRWRLSFHTWCEEHRRPLLDSCLRCGAEFVPHRSRRSVANCHQCGISLAWAPSPASTPAQIEAADLQGQMDAWLVRAGGGDHEARDLLCSLRVLASVALGGSRGQVLRSREPSLRQDTDARRLETFPIASRVPLLAWLARCYRGWPDSFRDVAGATGLTQQSFVRSGLGPMQCEWLKSEVQRLPAGAARRAGQHMSPVIAVLNEGVRQHKENWRASRAEVLMRKVVARGH